MKGRKPKPTALKVLAGDQPCRINKSEPKLPKADCLKPPTWLGTYAKQLWTELAPMLSDSGLLTRGDLPAFQQLCDEYDTIRRDPLCSAARDRYRRLLVEFGLTPSSRARLKGPAEKPRDALAEFLARKKTS